MVVWLRERANVYCGHVLFFSPAKQGLQSYSHYVSLISLASASTRGYRTRDSKMCGTLSWGC